tara:strand:+ start:526 stop:1815 length:1290 start_codon:yes stop_codon:yes gene_type:complete
MEIFKLLILTFFIAVIAWALTVVMRSSIEHASEFLIEQITAGAEYQWIIFVSVILTGAIIRALLITLSNWDDAYGDGATQSMQKFYSSYNEEDATYRYKSATFTQSVRRVVMTFLTLGTGGSGGLEGPAIPVGEGIGAAFAKMFKVNDNDTLRVLQVAGISACVCTLLQSPLTSVIFASEVVFCGRFIYHPMMFGLLSSLVAYFLNNHISQLEPLYYHPTHDAVYTLMEYAEISVVAILVSIPTGIGLRSLLNLFKKIFMPIPLVMRSPVAALLISGIVWASITYLSLPPESVIGVGEKMVGVIVNSDVVDYSFQTLIAIILIKSIVTCLTLMSGGSAGLLIPATFLGAFCGALAFKVAFIFNLTTLDSSILYIVTGLASSLVAVIEIPLTAIVLVIEIFGRGYGPSAILAVCVCNFFINQVKKRQALK